MFKKVIVAMISVMILTTIDLSFKGKKYSGSSEAAASVGGAPLEKATDYAIGMVPFNNGNRCGEAIKDVGLRIMLTVTKEPMEKEEKEIEKTNIEVSKEVKEKETIHNEPAVIKESNTNSQPQKVEQKEEVKENKEVVEAVKEPIPETKKENTSSENIIKDLPSKYSISYRSEIEDEVLALVNKLRSDNGLPPFTSVTLLKESSRYKSNSMVQLEYFSHNNPNYNNENSGYLLLNVFNVASPKVGENIAMYTDRREERINGQGLYNMWYNSEPHRKAMLSDSYTKIGIGVVTTLDSEGRIKIYGTQHFAK